MNNMNQNMERNEYTQNLEHGTPKHSRPRRKNQGFLRRITALTLSAALFGAVSAGTFYGVSALLPQENSSAAPVSAASTGAVLTSLASTSYSSTRYGMDVSDIAAAALPSVVSITNISVQEVQSFFKRFGPNGAGQTQLQETTSCGSGIIIANDGTWLYMVTNAHVVEKAVGIKVVLDNGEEYSASLIGSDTRTDIAVIKIEAQNLTYADFGNSDQVEEGERVVAIGNPTGMQLAGSTTQGIISALDRAVKSENGYTMRFLQTDAAINPGNSGGPLVNEFGQVIGINSAKYVNEGYEGIGFAIPINDALPIVEQLITNGKVTGRPMLGITGEPIDSVLSRMYSVPTGVHILSVDPNADIASKNVVPGDIITQVNGTAVASADDISQVLDGFKPGDKVKLTIYRRSNSSVGGRTFEVSVTLMSDNGDGTVSPASK